MEPECTCSAFDYPQPCRVCLDEGREYVLDAPTPGGFPPESAYVIRWNSLEIQVQCPCCYELEIIKDTCETARHYCQERAKDENSEYFLAYPFDVASELVGYTVNKTIGYFETLGTSLLQGEAEEQLPASDENTLAQDLNLVAKCERLEATLLSGNIEKTKRALDRLSRKNAGSLLNFQLPGRQRTMLHVVACEDLPKMIPLLIRYGAQVDALDSDNRTPLMIAALWGRLPNVVELIEHGANRTLEDRHEYTASYLSSSIGFFDRERERMSHKKSEIPLASGNSRSHKHGEWGNTVEAKSARIQINDLLKKFDDMQTATQTISAPSTIQAAIEGFQYQKNYTDRSISLIRAYGVPNLRKTVARLNYFGIAGTGFSPVDAMSGWAATDVPVIGGRNWTDEVLQLAAHINYAIPAHPFDQGVSGQYYATHAEKQLAAYFVSNHVVLESDSPVLKEAQPPENCRLRGAAIIVSTLQCDDCVEFFAKLNRMLGLNLEVFLAQ
ncbi:Fc.00g071470.m01.CDS01 [Cosmosporella sp. VM-42]